MQFDCQRYGTVAAAGSAADRGYSTYKRNPPESDLFFQVTVIGLFNRGMRGSTSRRDRHTAPFAANPAAFAAKWRSR